ncbi:MAG: hypothetical protein E6G29_02630 [Actinobacteria bacterium]|nr:MAG: hypothetical protein E6G29_02630 [Actinomycetota bacterium]
MFSVGASAQQRTFVVRLPTGQVINVTVDTSPSTPPSQIGLPGKPLAEIKPHSSGGGNNGGGGGSGSSNPSNGGSGQAASNGNGPSSSGGSPQGQSHGPSFPSPQPQPQDHARQNAQQNRAVRNNQFAPPPLRNKDGSPNIHNPTFVNALPSPNNSTTIPNFVIRQFQVPLFLLPIYQAAGNQYDIRWQVLAAINEIESDYGRNLSVSTAGAVGWMQFLPSTWKTWGVDANGDRKKDPYNPVDAIFAAARYLKAAGGSKNIRKAIFAYNHANWYVDSVMMRAKLLSGVPGPLIDSLSGLTEGRFPVAAHARYADDFIERQIAGHQAKKGQPASTLVSDRGDRNSVNIFSSQGAPVVAVNDGQVKQIGNDKTHGQYLILQDVFGNQYRYNGLGEVSKVYPVPKGAASGFGDKVVSAHGEKAPKGQATAGRQLPGSQNSNTQPTDTTTTSSNSAAPHPTVAYRPRIFAHPDRPNARGAGSLGQLYNETASIRGLSHYDALFASVLGLNDKNAVLKPLKPGSLVVAGTLLGRIGKPDPAKAPHVNFQLRPAGKGAPSIDPKPILDGWKLLESTNIYGPHGKNALTANLSIGQILLLSKSMLEKRVLGDSRVIIYSGGQNDIKTHQIDRRVLAVIEFLADSGFRPTISALKSGHSEMTNSGNVSEHSSGNAVDVSKINDTPVLGHQDKGGIVEQVVKRLMTLQGYMRPHQIISLFNFGGNTLSLPDHANHVHIGYRPLFGNNKKLGEAAAAVLKPGQWNDLISRLRKLSNPTVPTSPSKFAIPAGKKH